MDDKAYHLQARAHVVVKQAIDRGDLVRQPCEECGQQPARAHHDSYHPDKWLSVRWLCGKHHRQWHVKNEPEWPTIYEYHPSDAEYALPNSGKAGRPPRPWYWKQRSMWAVHIAGKRYELGRDPAKAMQKFYEPLASRQPGVQPEW